MTTDFDSVAATTGLGKNVTVSYSEGARASPNSPTFTVDVTYKFTETVQDVDSGYTGTMGGGRYVKFGDWPQTVMASGVTVDRSRSQTMGMFTCYLGSDGNWYVDAAENAYGSGTEYQYSNGEQAGQGGTTTKWFKVETIVWRVLNKDYASTNKAMLLAEKILTGGIPYYDVYNVDRTVDGATIHPNNYEHSAVRAWLNGLKYQYKGPDGGGQIEKEDYFGKGFLQTAFTQSARDKIAETTVDNSKVSTNPNKSPTLWQNGENQYACANTSDKIFLLSEQEATTLNSGFAAYDARGKGNTRIRVTTDYAKATGAESSTDGYGGWWWLRSPYCVSGDFAYYIASSAHSYRYFYIRHTHGGVVPALCVQLP